MLPYLLAGALALGALGGWKMQSWRFAAHEKQRIEHEAEVRKQRERGIDMAAEGHEKDKARIRTQIREVVKEVDRVVEKPVYRNVCIDDDGLRLIRSAVLGQSPSGEPARAVPGTPAPIGRQGRDPAALDRGHGARVP